jgi:predicted amidohydrolase
VDSRIDVEEQIEGASRLYADAGLAPMSSLGVVSVRLSSLAICPDASSPKSSRALVDVEGIALPTAFAPPRAAPKSRLSSRNVVPDGVARSEADPLGDGPVLLLRLRKLLLGTE